eukprot:SAG22_NODE_957_length_6316_cov_2.176130_9_plen_67_part_00
MCNVLIFDHRSGPPRSAACMHPCSEAEVDQAVQFAAEASTVPAQLWHDAKAGGLLPPEIPLPSPCS